MNHILPLLARLLLVPIFINSGIKKLADPEGTVAKMQEGGITVATELFMYGSVAFLLLGSLLVLLGYKTRVGAFMLLLFIIPTTLLFHWDLADDKQLTQLYKNMGLAAALLMLLAHGAGGASLDAKLKK